MHDLQAMLGLTSAERNEHLVKHDVGQLSAQIRAFQLPKHIGIYIEPDQI